METKSNFFFKEKYRINSMNIFKEGIKPMWEDEQNKGGKYFQLDYWTARRSNQSILKETVRGVHWKD